MRRQERRAKAIELAIEYHMYRARILIDFQKPTKITGVGFHDVLETAQEIENAMIKGLDYWDKVGARV